MAFQLSTTLVGAVFKPVKQIKDGRAVFSIELSGTLGVHFPGRIVSTIRATFQQSKVKKLPHGESTIIKETKDIPVTLTIFTPDGAEFKKKDISLPDLRKFRTPRGLVQGTWSYQLKGETPPILVDPLAPLGESDGFVSVEVIEQVRDESAPLLVANQPIPGTGARFSFDLFRVGLFSSQIFTVLPWKGTTRLIDPDGKVVASTTGKRLSFDVGLQHLRKPRSASKAPAALPQWTLEVLPGPGIAIGNASISATVIASLPIRIAAITDRVRKLIGANGSFVKVFGENSGGRAKARFMITDAVAAETINMHRLAKRFFEETEPGGDILPGKVYTIKSRPDTKSFSAHGASVTVGFDVGSIRVGAIRFRVGPGGKLGASVPTLFLSIDVSGDAAATFKGVRIASAKVRGGRIDLEIGLKFEADGSVTIVRSVPDDLLDIDPSKLTTLLSTVLAGIPLIVITAVLEKMESEINAEIVEKLDQLLDDPTLAPRLLMLINGGHFKYLPPRITADTIFLDHVAPVEPEARPQPRYRGAIGRKAEQPRPGNVNFTPATLPDTWAAGQLAKIEHVVVVMMENRSYDHVLGYRTGAPIADGADGLSARLIQAIESVPTSTADVDPTPYQVRNLKQAGFKSNSANLKTLFPKPVAHKFTDVAEQLRFKATGTDPAQPINSPLGFRNNFASHLGGDPKGVIPNDVLGFYDDQSLPFFAYLAKHYAYCDRYFSSHPGPTLPNRFYSLAGNLDHDRTGVPVLENSRKPDLIQLSRAPTIYDFLARFGLDFRVYESFPSVTMLRMFARYATDTRKLVALGDDFEKLRADVKQGRLPPLVAIEPRMHTAPRNDDHTPNADMLLGQRFVKGVYDALRSNPAVWAKTLLIVTYDEHGGFYDHVIPPAADVFGVNTDPSIPGVETSGGGKPDDKTTRKPVAAEIVPYGVRVPTFIVSPWVAPGRVVSDVFDHCSILKTVLARFMGDARPFMSDRVEASRSFNDVLTEAKPRLDVPDFTAPLPEPVLDAGDLARPPSRTTKIVTPPISLRQWDDGSIDYHDLTGWWARQLGR